MSERVNKLELSDSQKILEQTLFYEKRISDLEQLLGIAKSFCENQDFNALLDSIVFICKSQMHVLGAEIFVHDFFSNEELILETGMDEGKRKKLVIPVKSRICLKLLSTGKGISFEKLKKEIKNSSTLDVLESLSPTLIVPLIQRNRLIGILVLQERIVVEGDTSYTEYEQNQIMSIATLASVAIYNAALLEISATDMMTHLKLKYYFYNLLSDKIDSAFLNNQNIAVLMLDIDFFKNVNDTYGHDCGDYVLIKVADIIKSSLRENDIACRYGGEEFTVYLYNTGKEEGLAVAERIRRAIENYDFVYEDNHIHLTISVGVSIFDSNNNLVKSPREFVHQADMGLYLSKFNGRNKVTLYEHFD